MATIWLIQHGNEEKHKAISVQTQKYADNTIGIDVPFYDINSQVTIAKLQLDAQETAFLIAKLAGHLAHLATCEHCGKPLDVCEAEQADIYDRNHESGPTTE